MWAELLKSNDVHFGDEVSLLYLLKNIIPWCHFCIEDVNVSCFCVQHARADQIIIYDPEIGEA